MVSFVKRSPDQRCASLDIRKSALPNLANRGHGWMRGLKARDPRGLAVEKVPATKARHRRDGGPWF
jgi:hypothetical protein